MFYIAINILFGCCRFGLCESYTCCVYLHCIDANAEKLLIIIIIIIPSKLFYLAESRRRWIVVHSKNQKALILKGKEYTTIRTEFISSIYNKNELHQLRSHIRATWASDPTSWADSGFRTHGSRKRARELLKHYDAWSQQSKWEKVLDVGYCIMFISHRSITPSSCPLSKEAIRR